MEFNVGKCKVMHLGRLNQCQSYTMGGENLEVTTEERDLGVLFDNKLDFGNHIRAITNKANRMLGMIKMGFTCMDKEIFMNLYPVLVRPLLEYCVQVWSPSKQKHINIIKRVLRRATKMVPALRNKPYEERLIALGLTKLVERRFRGDMIQTYKIVTGKENVNREKFFQMVSESRGDPELLRGEKIFKKRSKNGLRANTFSQRVVTSWNKLSKNEVQAKKTSGFKAQFDKNELVRRSARSEMVDRDYRLLYNVV